MTVHDVERAGHPLLDAVSRIAYNATRANALKVRGVNGLRAAQRGLLRLPQPDGREVADPKGPAVVPLPDQAAEDMREVIKRVKRADIDLAWVMTKLDEYERLDLEPYRDDEGGIIAQHPGRWATEDERKVADEESLEDDGCRSCRRLPGNYSGVVSDGMCSTCLLDLNRCKALLIEMGDPKKAAKLTWPPKMLVEMRHEGRVPRSDSYKTAVAPGADKRRSKRKAGAA